MSNKLELTWYNKYKQKNIEPRILVKNIVNYRSEIIELKELIFCK